MRKIFFPNLHIGFERWKYCMALDIYVSSHGRIKNASGEIQNLCAKNNYLYYKGKAVHRLVAQTFNPVPNYANLTVDHRDHNTRNNCLSNLEWVTQEENQQHAIRTGLRKNVRRGENHPFYGKFGANSHSAKPVVRVDPVTGETKLYKAKILAGDDGFDVTSISKCCHGKLKTHKGYEWYFAKDFDKDIV
jgi:hypothetical protein